MAERREVWRDIPGTDGHYQISNCGRVCSCYRGAYRPIKTYVNSAGYVIVTIEVFGIKKPRQVHRLVASAFVPEIEGKALVHHIDGDRTHNHAQNLAWVTNRENVIAARDSGAKFGAPHHEKPVVRSDGAIYRSISEAARALCVPYGYIRDTVRGKQKTCRGFGFRYLGGDAIE